MHLAPSPGGRLWPIFIGCVMAGATLAATAPSQAALFGDPQTIPLASDQGQPAEPLIRVLRTDADGLLLEFTLPGLQVQRVDTHDGAYHLLSIEGGSLDGEDGQPALPIFGRMVQIPDRAGLSWQVTEIETTELSGYRPFPMQPEDASELVIDREAYTRSGYPAGDPVRIGEPAIARDLRVVPILFAPVRFDGARQTLEVVKRLVVQITFAGVDLRNAREERGRAVPARFDELYRHLVVNYAQPNGDRAASQGEYLLICPNDPAVISALQPLIEWRTRKGFHVRLATTAETGTSREAIKAWLQTAYLTWETPPEFVCLVGDADGSIALPCWTYSSGETDHPYTQLDGDDQLSEIFIGRISVDSVERLSFYVTKIVGYESTPYMTDTNWYTRGCLVGDPTSSGYSCVQVMQWVKTQLRNAGYTEVDTVFAGPWVSQITAAANRGDTVFSYRGYYGTSGLNNGHISSLQNGWKMPFAPTITCGTGGFASGTSMSETWIRAGVPPDRPTGGIASIGMSTLSTVTRYNNCLTYGFWRSIFLEDHFRFGESFTRGKYELYVNYGANGGALNHTHWANLMGDPGGEIWTGVPRSIAVSHPASIPLGANSVTVDVTVAGEPCPDAYVCLWKGDEVHVGGYTDAAGAVELNVGTPTAGVMRITVTKHDHYPYLANIPVAGAEQFVGYVAHTIDDDASGSSSGNGDGLVNPLERIEVPVQVENFGTLTASGVTATLTSEDPYVVLLDATETFGDIAPGGTAWSADDFDIEIDAGAPDGHVARLGLDVQSGTETWRSLMEIPIASAAFVYDATTLYGMGPQVDPGESGEVSVRIVNKGAVTAGGVTGILRSQSTWLEVTDSLGAFGDLAMGDTGENTTNRFAIHAADDCFPGHVAPMVLCLEFSGGARDTLSFTLTVGVTATGDPTGPDAYGYYAFDNTDISYVQAPSYSWVEIDPNHGGSGTSVGLSDFGLTQDDSQVVPLPFPFIFYGQAFTRATICSNGWISMGSTYITNWNNWSIPGAGAPPYLIAPMWDDLYQSGTDLVYHWYDSDTHRYIVQWSRLRNIAGDRVENFEVIFYDPAHYPTDTGDGEFVFQYAAFENSDNTENYCTVGIENEDQTTGVLYTYYNQYTAGSPTITPGCAIKFATYSDVPSGVLMGTIRNATNGGTPLEAASVRLLESGRLLMSGPDGVYGGGVRVGDYTAVASHPSFAPDTTHHVIVTEGQTTVADFALRDILPPAFAGTTQYANTSDTVGPYMISTTVTEYSDFAELSLVYKAGGAGWVSVPMVTVGGNTYAAGIPGQPHGSLVRYYIAGEDVGGNAATDPPAAPIGAYEFWVLQALFADDMELGAGDWFHYVVGDTFYDQWHLSVQRNHTPGGTSSWKFGDEGSGDYVNLAGAALETPPIQLTPDATLSFWHWIDAEISQAHQGYCYDGGIVEISVDGGAWTQITPVGGYPYRVRTGSIPGPFPAETPAFSGTFDWTQVRFELGDVAGEVRLRFHFGGDGAVAAEGWYIDDIEIVPGGLDPSGTDEVTLLPSRMALYRSAPNPFPGAATGTQIRFDLPQAGHVQLQIFDPGGRLVRTLVDDGLTAGQHRFVWDGRDARAHPAVSGVYLCVLKAAGQRQTKEILLVK